MPWSGYSLAAICWRCILQQGIVSATPAADNDAVLELPGYGEPPSQQWSGYLDASEAEPGTMLHYWFAKAESPEAHNLPVVLWLNGGPGSTSVLGMMEEHGPLLINATGGLMRNPYAWTKQANLLILESPAGVGYSYCAAMLTGGVCKNTDKSTAAANRAAIRDFFRRKFPDVQKNPFYITGESYAGVYVPTLTKELLDNAPEVNIQGLAVGDPCTDNEAQTKTMDMLWYSHKYGFLPDTDFHFLWKNCSARYPSFLARGNWRREGGHWRRPVNPAVLQGSSAPLKLEGACLAAHRRFLAASSRAFSQDWPLAWVNDLTLYGHSAVVAFDQPGSLNWMVAQWMMRPEVRNALHVEVSLAATWPGPPDGWQYQSDYRACNWDGQLAPGTPSMVDFYRNIAPRLARTIVFNGDTDPCVSYEGTRTAIESVGFEEVTGGQYRPWFYDHTKADLRTLQEKPGLFGPDLDLWDSGPQLGGHVRDYAFNLSFVTVHGSGHMVPQFRPQAAETLLRRLLTGTPFAPPLPSNAELETMTETDFDDALDAWTHRAKSPKVATAATALHV